MNTLPFLLLTYYEREECISVSSEDTQPYRSVKSVIWKYTFFVGLLQKTGKTQGMVSEFCASFFSIFLSLLIKLNNCCFRDMFSIVSQQKKRLHFVLTLPLLTFPQFLCRLSVTLTFLHICVE